MARAIREAMVKGINEMNEVLINENKEQRNIQLEYLHQRQLQPKLENKEICDFKTSDNEGQNELKSQK